MEINVTKTKFEAPCECCLSENRGEVFSATFIGVQQGLSKNLNLFRCDGCTTTRAQRAKQPGKHYTEVRCCCKPQKLLGWVEGKFRIGERWNQAVADGIVFDDATEMTGKLTSTCVSLEAAEMYLRSPYSRIIKRSVALKAEGVDIAVLRRMTGFIERQPYMTEPGGF